jgi:hypothetical protein
MEFGKFWLLIGLRLVHVIRECLGIWQPCRRRNADAPESAHQAQVIVSKPFNVSVQSQPVEIMDLESFQDAVRNELTRIAALCVRKSQFINCLHSFLG